LLHFKIHSTFFVAVDFFCLGDTGAAISGRRRAKEVLKILAGKSLNKKIWQLPAVQTKKPMPHRAPAFWQ